MMHATNDVLILAAITAGVLRVNAERGLVYAMNSNFPGRVAGSLTRKGYLRVGFMVDGRKVNAMVHRVVWIAARGIPDDPSAEVNHKSGVKTANDIDNLELLSSVANAAHAKTNGLLRPARGEASGHARLTSEQVSEIKRRALAGERSALLANEFGITPHHVRHIATGKRWTPNQTYRLGKKAAGRALDGRTHDEFPEVT